MEIALIIHTRLRACWTGEGILTTKCHKNNHNWRDRFKTDGAHRNHDDVPSLSFIVLLTGCRKQLTERGQQEDALLQRHNYGLSPLKSLCVGLAWTPEEKDA